jgi:hypothetical protein
LTGPNSATLTKAEAESRSLTSEPRSLSPTSGFCSLLALSLLVWLLGFLVFCFFYGTGLMLARQARYHLSHSARLNVSLGFFFLVWLFFSLMLDVSKAQSRRVGGDQGQGSRSHWLFIWIVLCKTCKYE